MKKRLISTIMAMTAIVSMTGITANAVSCIGNINDICSEEFLSTHDEIDVNWMSEIMPNSVFYLSKTGASITAIRRTKDTIFFTVSNKIDETDIIMLEEKIKEIDSDLHLYGGTGVDNEGNPFYGINRYGVGNVDIETKTVKKLYDLLKDDVLSFDFECDMYEMRMTGYQYPTAYEPFMNEDKCNTQVLEKFITENEINAQIVTYKNGEKDINGNEIAVTRELIYVIPEDDISATEHLELAEKIYESTGLAPHGISPLSVDSGSTGTTIDVYNAIDGDANNDGALTVADAAAILQYLGNAEKFPISAQGKFNADIAGDGITAADALTVQRMVLQSANKI